MNDTFDVLNSLTIITNLQKSSVLMKKILIKFAK